MKLLFSFIFLFFLSFSTQAQGLFLIEEPNSSNMEQFDWQTFINKENIKKYIDKRNELFDRFGGGVINGIRLDKIHLVRIEQELKLYEMGIKAGLSPEMIQATKEAITLHWKNVNNTENQVKAYAGLRGSVAFTTMEQINEKDYYNGTWKLYEADHEIVFNMVKKGDKLLYKTLGSNDEFYVKFIILDVKRPLERITNTAEAYYNSLGSELNYKTTRDTEYRYIKGPFKNLNVTSLTDMYLNSLKIYNSFIENFKTPIGKHQKELMRAIKDWHIHIAFLAVKGWIDSYKIYGVNTNPVIPAARLRKFYEAPMEVKQEIAIFLRNDIFYNKIFTNTDDKNKFRARVNALIGLHALGVATVEEENLYNQAVEQGIITPNVTHANSYAARSLPLPDVTNKAKEQNIIKKKHTHSGSDLSFLDTAS